MKQSNGPRLSLILVAILVVPSVVFLTAPEATGQASFRDAVPFAQGETVGWQNISNLKTRFHVKSSLPDPSQDNPTPVEQITMDTIPPAPSTDGTPRGRNVQIAVLGGQGAPVLLPAAATVRGGALTHEVNVSGQNAVFIRWSGAWPEQLSWTVTLRTEGPGARTVGTLQVLDQADDFSTRGPNDPCEFQSPSASFCQVEIVPTQNRFTARQGARFVVDIRASEVTPGGLGGESWNLRTGDPARPTFLELRTENGVKVAAWTESVNEQVTRLFKPDARKDFNYLNKMTGVFAVKSAFGARDVCCERRVDATIAFARPFQPTGHILYQGNETPYPITKANLTSIDLSVDSSNSTLDQGILAFRFPTNLWNYGDWPHPRGAFTFRVQAPFRADDPGQSTGLQADWDFVISDQNLFLRPFDDLDPNTLPSPLESQSHETAAGQSTTFLLLGRNRANFSDNATVQVELVSSQPRFGWQARVGGEDVIGGSRIPLGPGQEKLITVTVTAPADAAIGQSAVYSVRLVSGLDSQTRSQPYTLITTVSNVVRENVGVVLTKNEENVRPGQDNLLKAYLWNRGSRPANLTMELREQPQASWNVTLVDAGVDSRKVTVRGVPAGDIVPITVKVRPEVSATVGSLHNVTLNATLERAPIDGPGMQTDFVFRLVSLASFRVELLQGINSRLHHLEMSCQTTSGPLFGSCSPAGDSDAPADATSGTWFRVWVTNTGDVPDTYDLALVNPGETERDGDPPRAFDSAVGNTFQIGVKAPNDRFTPRSSIDLNPKETGEFYVWVGHRNNTDEVRRSTFTFDVSVTSRTTKVELRRTGQAIGEDGDFTGSTTRKNALKLEHVQRSSSYFEGGTRPVVDTANARKTSVQKFIDLSGTPQLFYVRLTNGASWSDFTDENGRKYESSARVFFTGVQKAREDGWNITMRARNGVVEERLNPYLKELNFNQFSTERGRFEAFRDHELEILVRPPVNGTTRVTAGDSLPITIGATQSGKDTTSFTTYIEMVVTVGRLPNMTMRAPRLEEFVHAGGQTAFTLYIANNGSVAAPASLQATVTEDSPNAPQWSVTQQNLNLSAHENRTVALIVSAPAGLSAGQKGVINVSLDFPKVPEDPESERVTRYLELTAVVKERGQLTLTAIPTAVEAAPGGIANFTFEVTNADTTRRIPYRVTVPALLNWTQSFPNQSVAEAGFTDRFAYLLQVPTDVLRGRTYESVVKIEEVANPDSFDVQVVTINIVGGQPSPLVTAVRTQGLVDRGDITKFAIGVKNLGNTEGRFPLTAQALDPAWGAYVQDAAGNNITDVTVAPGDRKSVTLVVKAPANVPEGRTMPVTLTAFNPRFDRSSAATVRAVIHDYGVDVELRPGRTDAIAGSSSEFTLRVTNLGNGNDTIKVTGDLGGLREWSMDFSAEDVTLAPGSTSDVLVIVATPTTPLPTPRSYTLSVKGASTGGEAKGFPKTDTAPVIVDILNYRAFDIDGDNEVELAVDRNKRTSDGFETFREVFRTGAQSREVDNLSGKQDGKITFLVDVPTDGDFDGIANVYFDPNEPFVQTIEFTPDVNGDGTPDYLLDVDNDGVVDHAWDTATRSLWNVTTIFALGGTKPQFLIDTSGDGVPDRYYDPEINLVTRTIRQDDPQSIGIDTDNSGKTSKLYDMETGRVTDATADSFASFFGQYWYFFGAFALVLVLFGVVLAKRRQDLD